LHHQSKKSQKLLLTVSNRLNLTNFCHVLF